MKNLKLSWEVTSSLQLQSKDETLQFAAFDIERNRLFFASSANLIYTAHIPSSQDEKAWEKTSLSLEVEPLDLETEDFITSFDYLMEKEALIVGTSSGLLLLHSVQDNATEIVGKVEGGVRCISPNPDGDLLAIITGFNQILVMTHDWDLLYEMALEDIVEDVDVSESTCPSHTLERHISWRGDGKYFATLTMAQNSNHLDKKIKVWERDSGALHSVSDPKSFAAPILEWMSNGMKIAAVYDCKEENKCPSIVFFEKNGLQRSSFSVNEDLDSTVESLKWNCNSDLLAAVIRCEKHDSIKIWHFSNNHWYLKQEFQLCRQDGFRFMWNPTKPLQLICWSLDGQITIFNFYWVTAVMDNSTALVIDGPEILVTPLAFSLIPPPMFLFNLQFPTAVRDIAFCSKGSKNHLAASLSNGRLCVVELPQLDTWEQLEDKTFVVEACLSESAIGSFVHLVWLDTHLLLGVSHFGLKHSHCAQASPSGKDGLSGYCLQEIELFCSEDHVPGSLTCSGWHVNRSSQVPIEEPVIGIVPSYSRKHSSLVQFIGGKIFQYMSRMYEGETPVPSLQIYGSLKFLSSCPWMYMVPIGDSGTLNYLLFGLDENSRLHVNGRILCNNCSSFSLYSNFGNQVITHLLLATKQDLLFVVDIADVLNEKLEAKYENFMPVTRRRNEEDKKNYIVIWEKGARVVGVLHGDEAAVILQTIRGNVECVYPRKLVLASIINALAQGRYRDALLMVRRQRIDFNVIIDHCGWQAFIKSAQEFVRQVSNLSHVTEFVCSIKNEDILETLYKNYISQSSKKDPGCVDARSFVGCGANTKVSSVLLAIRKALEEHVVETPERELCILTTLARSDPPALEEALKRIKIIREMELLDSPDPKRSSYPSAEEALKHLLWLSDSDAVYEAALGLYDLNLAAIVALNSQRDPKEFLPFLQELELMPVLIKQYNIDLKLRRYESALRNLIMAGDISFADCMNLMKNFPELFPLGLQLVSEPLKRRQVLEAWGDHLDNGKYFEDAATTYLSCSCLEKALKAYRACGNWSGVLTVAGLIRLGKEEVIQLAHELCEELQALGKPGEAAKIAFEYCGDVSGGINFLVSARDWEEALRVAFLHMNEEIISRVKSASLECANISIGEYVEALEKVGKYLTRYLAVRQRRILLAAKLQSDEHSVLGGDDDTASEASSNFSGMSAYTTGSRKGSAASVSTRTSKARDNRRQRNKGKIRAGSPDEEVALVDHIKGMSLTTGAKRELKSLLVSLLMLGEVDIARKLQRTVENFQLSQMAAVKLCDDATSSDIIDELAYSLDRYTQKLRKEAHDSDDFAWRSQVLQSY